MKKQLIMICCMVCAAIMVCFTSIPAVVAAPDSCSLILEYEDEQTDEPNDCTFQLYMIAEGIPNDYQMTEAFEEKKVDVEQTDWDKAEEMNELAAALTAHLTDEGIAPDQEMATDQTGRAAFSDLSFGLYLALGEDQVKDGYVYKAQQVVIWLPYEDPDGDLNYAPICAPKYVKEEEQTEPERPETKDISVKKVWVDDGNHPSSVTVQLLCDEEVFDEIALREENGWEYLWEGLDASRDWQIKEINIPEGYTARVTKDGNAFTITNTKKLPQTGQLWWPVPMMLAAGAFLFLIGLSLLARGDKKAGGAGRET